MPEETDLTIRKFATIGWIALPAGLRGPAAYTATLAVSDEPLGGSPTGAPTGQIRAAGKFQRMAD